MYTRILMVVLVTLLSAVGCAPQMMWTKPGFNAADWQRDAYECKRDTRMSAASVGGGYAAASNPRNFAARCLQAKGYHLVEVGQPERERQTGN